MTTIAVAAARQVLQGMRFLGGGSILFVNGGSAVRPTATYAGTSIAFAGKSALAQMLHDTLKQDNIRVAQLIIPGAITPGDETHDPGVLADKLWQLHNSGTKFRVHAAPMSDAA